MKVYIYKVDKIYIGEKMPAIRDMLCDWRREKIDKLKVEDAILTSAGAGLLVQRALKQSFDISKDDIKIRYNEMGKPYLKGREGAYFNLAHSGNYCVVLTDDQECGVDIETKDDRNFAVTRRLFTDKERSLVCNALEDEKQIEFRKIWTMKEAYLKLSGTGISIPLNSFEVAPERCKVQNGNENIYLINETSHKEEYIIAIASKKDKFSLDIEYIESI
ncbi:MAG: 4'-phosphopantetheinyl transferase superfamily protein [Eubacterium sp.]|nr:4'-phosphopantetheinyl transferase superfamily protein [Eubacterium sp.]